MLNFKLCYSFYLTKWPCHAVYTSIKVWLKLEKTTQSSALLQLLEASTFIAECGYQRLSTKREHGNAEDRFAIAVRDHSDTRADE